MSNWPFAIIKHDKNAGRVIEKHFKMVSISIADDKIKNTSINDVHQKRSCSVEIRLTHIITVMFSIFFPSKHRDKSIISTSSQ